jgi:asparagine synthase (glutamine-hydrolysing)
LAIQDLSPLGSQPMQDPRTGDLIVYNGELYNGDALRAELVAAGVDFRSRSDTEVLLAAFGRWGARCLPRLAGIFAFAVYSRSEERLYVARDHVGVKPLYWAFGPDGSFVFASELRGIVASGLVDVAIDRDGLCSLAAYGAVTGPRTMLRGVSLLEPGTFGSVDARPTARPTDLHPMAYWQFDARACKVSATRDVAEELRPVLADAVQSQLVSDVPVAVFLSAGLDSSAIAILASGARHGNIDTLTVRLAEDAAMDEAPLAGATARFIGARHHEVTLGEGDARALATRWMASLDQPSVDGINTFVIARAARERGIVVALSGLGGDELFGGYSSFREVPRVLHLARILSRVPSSASTRLARALSDRDNLRMDRLADLFAIPPTASAVCLWRRRLMSNRQIAALGLGAAGVHTCLTAACDPSLADDSRSTWEIVRSVEARHYMANMLLRDTDVFGMSHGVEIRVPLLDPRVVEVALKHARSPWSASRGPNKPWLAAALGNRIPPMIARRRKSGFALPQDRWMRGPLRQDFADRIEGLATSGYLEAGGVRAIWQTFLREPGSGRMWSRAWLLGALGEWLSRVESDGIEARRSARTLVSLQS